MSSVTNEEGQLVVEGGVSAHSEPRRSYWPLWVLIVVNASSPLAMLASIYLSRSRGYYAIADRFLIPCLSAVMFGQLFLLAFWMCFGSWPIRWRGLFIFAITSVGGLVFGVAIALIEYSQRWYSSFYHAAPNLILVAGGTPIIAGILVGMANAFLVIPAWYFGYEIGRCESKGNARMQSRTFGVSQMLIWVGQAAIPLGLLQAFAVLDGQNNNVLAPIVPYLFAMACAAPLAVAMLKRRFSILAFAAACLWAVAVGVASNNFSDGNWDDVLPGWSFPFLSMTIIANTLLLRFMGLCWQPRVEPAGVADG